MIVKKIIQHTSVLSAKILSFNMLGAVGKHSGDGRADVFSDAP